MDDFDSFAALDTRDLLSTSTTASLLYPLSLYSETRMLTLCLGLLLVAAGVLIAILSRVPKQHHLSNLPPSPAWFPFMAEVGRSWLNGTPFHNTLTLVLNQASHPLLFTQLGAVKLVVSQDHELIRETLLQEDWVDRFYIPWMAQRSFGKNLGVLAVGGDVWREMRRFCLRALRESGFGAPMLKSIANEVTEVREFLLLQTSSGEMTLEVKGLFTVPILNILWRMLTGDRIAEAGKEGVRVKTLLQILHSAVEHFEIGGPNALTFHATFPRIAEVLSHFSGTIQGAQFTQLNQISHAFFQEFLAERRSSGAYKNAESNHYVDIFLREIDVNIANGCKNYFTDEQFITVTTDLLIAGSETSSNTLEFAILYLVLYPEVQRRIQAEIDTVVGTTRLPVITDKSKMPYTVATLLEVNRRASVSVYAVRSPVRDSRIGKYMVPKGTLGLFNLYGMNMDESTWEKPEEFNPERFLDANNNRVINANKLLTFGLGRRACFGEVLATATLFTFLTGLLQKFTFQASTEHGLPSMKQVPGMTLSVQPFTVTLKQR